MASSIDVTASHLTPFCPSGIRRVRALAEVHDLGLLSQVTPLGFSRLGKPSDNALVDAFNSRFRQECSNQHWLLSLGDAGTPLSAWKNEYRTERPHGALGDRTPLERRIRSPMLNPQLHISIQTVDPGLDP